MDSSLQILPGPDCKDSRVKAVSKRLAFIMTPLFKGFLPALRLGLSFLLIPIRCFYSSWEPP